MTTAVFSQCKSMWRPYEDYVMFIAESGEIAQQLKPGTTSSEDLSWFPANGRALAQRAWVGSQIME